MMITTPVTLVGESADGVIVDGKGGDKAIYIHTDGALINNMKITNAKFGVYIGSSGDVIDC